MTVRLVPKVKATVISPGTELSFLYKAGETLPAKSPICKGETDGRIYLTQADDLTRMPCFGFTIESGEVGESVKVISIGTLTNVPRDADFSPDDAIYISVNRGKLTRTPTEATGSFVQTVARAVNASNIILAVDQTMVEIA